MLKTPETDAVIQAVLQVRSKHIGNRVAPKPHTWRELAADCLFIGGPADTPHAREYLLRAAAYIVAELERMERAEAKVEAVQSSETMTADAYVGLRAGVDYPCSLHPGPMGECSERTCRCY